MDVTIFYTESFDPAPGGVHRFTTPMEPDMDEWIACFAPSSDAAAWGLRLQHLEKARGDSRPSWRTKRVLLSHKCSDMADYSDWLCENVSYVLVDGQLFWTNPGQVGEDDEGGRD